MSLLAKPMQASASQRAAIAARRPVTARPTAPMAAGHVEQSPVTAPRAGSARRATPAKVMAKRAELASRFPKCFKPAGAPKLPLMIGIDRAVLEAAPDLDRHDVANAIADYCTGKSYHAAMVAGAVRVDLSGAAAGVVTGSAAAHSKARLKKLP
jgi:RNA chaperone ProQ/FINO-like protein